MKIGASKFAAPLAFLILGGTLLPFDVGAELPAEETVAVQGFVIIINDLVKVDEKGRLKLHETKPDAELNIQSRVTGDVRIGSDGFWYFKRGRTIAFHKPVMYLSNEKTVPLKIQVLSDAIDDQKEVKELPVLIKAENDEVGKRFKLRIHSGMMAGVLLRAVDG